MFIFSFLTLCLFFLFKFTILIFFIYIFFLNNPATTEIYTLSLHDALPISDEDDVPPADRAVLVAGVPDHPDGAAGRSEEHTSELQSPMYLVCRLLLEKKKLIIL